MYCTFKTQSIAYSSYWRTPSKYQNQNLYCHFSTSVIPIYLLWLRVVLFLSLRLVKCLPSPQISNDTYHIILIRRNKLRRENLQILWIHAGASPRYELPCIINNTFEVKSTILQTDRHFTKMFSRFFLFYQIHTL